jgi:hypothetical protein
LATNSRPFRADPPLDSDQAKRTNVKERRRIRKTTRMFGSVLRFQHGVSEKVIFTDQQMKRKYYLKRATGGIAAAFVSCWLIPI